MPKFLPRILCLFVGLPLFVGTTFADTSGVQPFLQMSDTEHVAIPFVENEGQLHPDVLYKADLFSGDFYVSDVSLTYAFPYTDGEFGGVYALKEVFVNAEGERIIMIPEALLEAEAKVHYLKGNQESEWIHNLSTYQFVALGEVYDDVFVYLRAKGSTVEKLFSIAPYGNVNSISILFEGAEGISIDEEGGLVVDTGFGDALFSAPVAWQEDGISVDVSYVLYEQGYGFQVGAYDHSQQLFIDPVLSSTYLNGDDTDDQIYGGIALDSNGKVFVLGSTYSDSFPVVAGAQTDQPDGDLTVTKLSADLSTIEASTYVGGSGDDGTNNNQGIAVDSSGNVFVNAYTSSTDYPSTGGYASDPGDSNNDVGVTKLSNDLSTIIASTYLGGSGYEDAGDLTLDSSGNVYVTLNSSSTDYPTTGGLLTNQNGTTTDIVVSKLNNSLSSLLLSTYINNGASTPSSSSSAKAILYDSINDAIYIGGDTIATNYPSTNGYSGDQGGRDGVITRLDNTFAITDSTYIGGAGTDYILDLAIDTSGNIYGAGYSQSSSTDMVPVNGGLARSGDWELYATKFSNGLDTLSNLTYLGGTLREQGGYIAIDSVGNVVVSGFSRSTDYPVEGGDAKTAGQSTGVADHVITILPSSMDSVTKSTYIGGTGDEFYGPIVLNSSNDIYLAGYSESTDYPIVGGADETSAGAGLAVVLYTFYPPATATAALSTNDVNTSSQYVISVTDADSIDDQGYVELTFPDEFDPSFDSLVDGDVAVSGTNITGSVETFDDTNNRMRLTLTTTGTLSDFDITIGDDGGPLNDLTNPSTAGVYAIGIDMYESDGTYAESTNALVEIDSEVSVTAIVTEALIMTLSGNAISLTVDPAVNDGQDLSESTTVNVATNSSSGYVLKARLDDGSGQARLVDGNGNAISSDQASGENYFSYTARNDGTGSATTAEQDFSATNTNILDDSSDSIGLGTVTDSQDHTVNYDLNVNFLTPAGVYTGTIYYTVVASF